MLKLSQHTLFYDDYPKPNEYLVFNTRTQAVIEINQQTRDFIDQVCSGNGNRKRFEDCTNEQKEVINTLKESGIVLDESVDEKRILEHRFNQIKYHTHALQITILTTYQCNFACFYCFEERVKQPKALEPKTAHDIMEWIKLKVEEKRPESLRVMFYGGEPLMNPKAVLEISKTLYDWCKGKTQFSCGMITNGSLIKPDLIDQLVKQGLTAVRVTLDGDKAHHDKRRPYIDGRGSFDRIIANISSIIDTVRVEVGGNFDKDNFDSLYCLLDYLEAKGLSKKIGRVLFAPVVARLGEANDNPSAPPVEMVGCHSLVHDLAQEAVKLRREVTQRGYNVDPALRMMSCPLEHDTSMVTIDPYGDIYKCSSFVGRPQFSVGNVCDEDFNYHQTEFMTTNTWKQCLDCVYLPMCGGGCRYSAQLQYSDYTKVACDIEYYQKIFPQLLKMDYERGAIA